MARAGDGQRRRWPAQDMARAGEGRAEHEIARAGDGQGEGGGEGLKELIRSGVFRVKPHFGSQQKSCTGDLPVQD